MTSPDLATGAAQACPYLGLPDDSRSRFTFATPAHRCHANPSQMPIELAYQGSFCLSSSFPACQRFRTAKPAARQGSGAGLVRRLRRAATLLAALALVLTAVLVAIRMGALGGSPARGGLPAPSASSSASATETPTPGPSSSLAPPSSPSGTGTPAPIIHVVAEDEWLSSIAELYGVTVEAIQAANGIDDPNLIYLGQELVIPTPP